jgi:hypothetical protein
MHGLWARFRPSPFTEKSEVVPLLVTSKIVPMQFTKTIGTAVISADEITAAFLATLANESYL